MLSLLFSGSTGVCCGALIISLNFGCSLGFGLITGGGVNVTLSVGVEVLPPDSEGVGLLVLELNGELFVERTVVASGVLDLTLLPSLKYRTLSFVLLSFNAEYEVIIVCLFVVAVELLCVGECGLIVIVVTCDFSGGSRARDWSGSWLEAEQG